MLICSGEIFFKPPSKGFTGKIEHFEEKTPGRASKRRHIEGLRTALRTRRSHHYSWCAHAQSTHNVTCALPSIPNVRVAMFASPALSTHARDPARGMRTRAHRTCAPTGTGVHPSHPDCLLCPGLLGAKTRAHRPSGEEGQAPGALRSSREARSLVLARSP